MWITSLDQIDLPLSVPILELLLARDGAAHVSEQFVVDEAMDVVAPCEAGECTITVLREPGRKIGCNPDVERPIMSARENVGTGLFLPDLHGLEDVEKWTLKQVQGDGIPR